MSFHALAGGRPMTHAKKRTAGFRERRDLLRTVFLHDTIPETRTEAKALVARSRVLGLGAGADDVLDAIVAAWSAHRLAAGEARRIPHQPERDERGLAMEIIS